MRDESLYLTDMLECIHKIESYTVDGRDAFLNTPMMQDAVIRNLEIIGEATKQLSPELRQASPDVRWQQIAGLRDVLIHGYMKVNLAVSVLCRCAGLCRSTGNETRNSSN